LASRTIPSRVSGREPKAPPPLVEDGGAAGKGAAGKGAAGKGVAAKGGAEKGGGGMGDDVIGSHQVNTSFAGRRGSVSSDGAP